MSKRVYLRSKPDQCSVCYRCVLVCAREHFGEPRTEWSALRIKHEMPRSYKVRIKQCTQCEQEYCVKACPTGALYRSEKGFVALDRNKCDSCNGDFLCADACKANLIFVDPKVPYPLKCDLCGGDPACIKECLPDILHVVEREMS